jgi:light-regulated signal transduction histidine kinase (bacteriophytochrome)
MGLKENSKLSCMRNPIVTTKAGLWAGKSTLAASKGKAGMPIWPTDASNDFESFSFSVAHGLRSSLRSINGFAKMLTDDKAEELDAEGKEYLRIIRDNALRMDRLFDDLMLLSGYYTAPLHTEPVNLNKLLRKIITGLNYKGEISARHMESVNADPEMMQQLWLCLLNNAVKFTSKKENPVIEIGAVVREGETVYYIKDNGAGFDMKYAAHLFTAFQRMHNETEFAGAGVGLAIARKIVTRHGGQIWAEAEIDKGAVFYFTLPQ